MKRPAVFFDRDNTLIVNDGYLGDPAGVILIEGAAEAIAQARSLGFATVVVSNQSGVARGLFDELAVHAVDSRMAVLLTDRNVEAIIDRHEFCPFHPNAPIDAYRQDSPRRKPRPGMLLAAADALDLDLSRSWLIGDAPRDIVAGKAAGCRTILFLDPALPASPAAGENGDTVPDFTVSSLTDALNVISKHAPVATPPPAATVKPTTATPAKTVTLSAVLAARKGSTAVRVTPAPASPTTAPVPTPPAAAPPTDPAASPTRLESLAEQILQELRHRSEFVHEDFSVSKLLAGILQISVLAVLLLGYLQGRGNVAWLQIYMLLALTLQAMTISLLIMSRMK